MVAAALVVALVVDVLLHKRAGCRPVFVVVAVGVLVFHMMAWAVMAFVGHHILR